MLGVVFRSRADYLIRHVSERRDPERGNYYLEAAEHGEPAGQWYGAGAAALGLTGEVDPEALLRLYNNLVHPVTGEQLGRKLYEFRSRAERLEALVAAEGGPVLPERMAELEMLAGRGHREARTYADATFSAPKSWSVLHAALERAGRTEEAAQVWDAWMVGVDAGLEYLMDTAGYSRAGRHGAKVAGRTSGRWVEGHDWVISLWRHHTSRDGDPQLHVHAAILNRVLCEDGKWRTLDSQAICRARPAAGAIAERAAEEALTARLGVQFATRPDGKAREIAGISEQARDLFSSRRRAITAGVAELARAYEERHGHSPTPYVLTLISEHVTLKTRARKPEYSPARAELLDAWEARAREVFADGLDSVLRSVGLNASREPVAGAFEPSRVVSRALAALQNERAVWTRHDLIAALNRELPDCLGGLEPRQARQLLEQLADLATSPGQEVVQLTAPELVPAPPELRRADGRSVYEPHMAERYATRQQLSLEAGVLAAAARLDAPAVSAERAQTLVRGAGLSPSQEQAVVALLSSGRQLDVLIGYAGVGKSFTVGQLARIWSEATGTPVLGLTTAERARQVLEEEGLADSSNIAKWLTKEDQSAARDDGGRLTQGQLIVVDEASMVTTTDFAEIVRRAQQVGAKVIATGDDQQLAAVGSGGLFRLLAAGDHVVTLEEVRRFAAAWEAPASVGLRAGQLEALYEYERRGRLFDGHRQEMLDQAVEAYLADHLSGAHALLVVPTNELAAELSSRVRSDLVRLGRVEAAGALLRDGNRAGVGDTIVCRRNDYQIRSAAGHPLINHESYRVTARTAEGGLVAHRLDSHGRLLSDPTTFTARYVAADVELGYASTEHSAQGRTVQRAHQVVDEMTNREGFYVGLTRGQDSNIAYVITGEEPPRPDEVRPDRIAVLAEVLEREAGQQSATEVMTTEQEASESLARLEPIWADLVGAWQPERFTDVLSQHLDDAVLQRLVADPAAPGLWRALRQAELAGADLTALVDSTTRLELNSARSPASVMTWRLEHATSHDGVPLTSYRQRTPERSDATGLWAQRLADAMDQRVTELGEQAAVSDAAWLRSLGQAPADPLERRAWSARTAAVAAYREAHSYHSPTDPIGPAPPAGAVEARASWERAYLALGRPDDAREVAASSDADLERMEAAAVREEAWAPAHVDTQLRDAHVAQRAWFVQAALGEARLGAERTSVSEQEQLERAEQVAQQRAAATRLAERVAALEEIASARSAWYEETRAVRDRATLARHERERRAGLQADLPPPVRTVEPPATQAEPPQLDLAGLSHQIEVARQAVQVVHERRLQRAREAADAVRRNDDYYVRDREAARARDAYEHSREL